MNSKAILAIAAFAALASAGARADDITIDNTPFNSVKSRAEVQAELAQFQTAGVNPWSTRYNPLAGFKSTKTRAQAQGEYIADRDQVSVMTAEDSGSSYLSNVATSRQVGSTLAGTPVNAR